MMTNDKFMCELLKYFARDDVRYPVGLEIVEKLYDELKDGVPEDADNQQYVDFHIMRAIQLDLLEGTVVTPKTLDPADPTITDIRGLTAGGENYVKQGCKQTPEPARRRARRMRR